MTDLKAMQDAESKEKRTHLTATHTETVGDPYIKVSFLNFGRVTVSLPLGALIVCFTSAIMFKFNEVNKTVCHVPNLIPSISAITGVTPERYIWRTCIALHCTPRFAVGFIYYNWYKSKLHVIAEQNHKLFLRLIRINFWLYIVENSCLVGVTYISNKENYPLHEKIFVVFMITSLFYEFLNLMLIRWTQPDMDIEEARAYKYKITCFVLIIGFTAGLIYFFLRHRLYCEPNAFTCFSLCEYGIAITNIIYHFTAVMDFRGRYWLCGTTTDTTQPQLNNSEKSKTS